MSERGRPGRGGAARPVGAARAGTPALPPVPRDPAAILDAALAASGIPAVAAVRLPALRLGIRTVRELLFTFPRRYDDLRELRPVAALRDLDDGTVASAKVVVVSVSVQQTFRRRVQVTNATLTDGTGFVTATWYGRRFVERRLREGQEIIVSGRIRHRHGIGLVLEGPEFQPAESASLLHVGRIVPVYRLTKGLTANRLRLAMRAALEAAGRAYDEYLPAWIRAQEALPTIGEALDAAHYPPTFEARDAALRRLAFDELLALQLGMVARRRARGRSRTRPVEVVAAEDLRIRRALEAALSRRTGAAATLTADQTAAIDAIRADLARPVPMLRLVQGDVGSGKTAVAAWALAAAAAAGRQGALLAPTELLARQHLATVAGLLEELGIPVVLLTGAMPAAARRAALEAIATGQAAVVVGTHALLQAGVAFRDLAVTVVDEQHRFGVEQRGALEAKASDGSPHVLLMTATPIPRTLGQVLYADLDVTAIRAAPAGRIPVTTAIRRSDELDRAWALVRREADRGRGTFVVVPRIGASDAAADGAGEGWSGDDELPDEEVEAAWAAAAEAEHARLTRLLDPLRVGLVHGRMRPGDRDAEMERFREGQLDVLVGTTVVEVGVDVPRATFILIEGAERFGLAQLHQLRGRVGRGSERSFCALVSDAEPGTTEHERLRAVESTNDGFELAERDFALRREGDVLGLAQSGLPRLRIATLADPGHRDLAARTRSIAETLLDERGELPAGEEALRVELALGWLRHVHAGDPATAA